MKTKLSFLLLLLSFAGFSAPKNSEILINGYSELYSNFETMTMSDLIITFKFESDKVEKLSSKVTSLGEKMTKDLKALKKKSSWLKLNDEGQSKFSKKVSEVSKERRVMGLMPLIGKDQKAFERSLLFLYGVLAQSNIDKIKVLKQLETDQDRIQFLTLANKKLQDLDSQASTMLEKYYFQ